MFLERPGFIAQPRFVCLHPVRLVYASSAALELRYYLGRDTLTVGEHTPGSNFAAN